MKDYTFLTRAGYFTELASAVAAAKPQERVIVATMSLDVREPLIVKLFDALQKAAANGAEVTVLIDAINLMVGDHEIPVPAFFRPTSKNSRERFGDIYQTLQALQAAGGTYRIINQPGQGPSLSTKGRSHIKAAVVGNQVFIGGCNLEQPELLDVMVTSQSKSMANTLANWLTRIADSERVRTAFGGVDIEEAIDAQTSVLLDAGVPGQSIIYDDTLELIDQAEQWLYITCQYFPGGPTAKHLAAAQARGVKVEIDYSHPRSHARAAVFHHIHQLAQRTRGLPKEFFSGRLDKHAPKLHAKVLISEKAALVGSHNYVVQGVNFGTAELALRSTDPAFGQQLRAFIRSQI